MIRFCTPRVFDFNHFTPFKGIRDWFFCFFLPSPPRHKIICVCLRVEWGVICLYMVLNPGISNRQSCYMSIKYMRILKYAFYSRPCECSLNTRWIRQYTHNESDSEFRTSEWVTCKHTSVGFANYLPTLARLILLTIIARCNLIWLFFFRNKVD